MLLQNKYWVIVLLFNLITNITAAVAAASGTYYAKWIFGNDNLVAVIGAAGMLATVIGFVVPSRSFRSWVLQKQFSLG